MRTELKTEIGYIPDHNLYEDLYIAEKNFPKCNILDLKNYKKPATMKTYEQEYILLLEAEILRLENIIKKQTHKESV